MKSKKSSDKEVRDDNVEAQTKLNTEASAEAEKDIEQDPDLHSEPEAGDDLDEGELARFEGEE